MIETLRPRLLSRRPIDAVVIPFPTDDTTPPVTKIYLGMLPSLPGALPPPIRALRAQDNDLHRLAKIGFLEVEARQRRDLRAAHLLQELADPLAVPVLAAPLRRKLHRNNHGWLDLADHFHGRRRTDRWTAADRHDQHVDRAHRTGLL